MAALPESVLQAWVDREDPVVLATADKTGVPNAIYVSCVGLFGKDRFVVADNYFDKTKRNIQDESRGAILFITKERKSYQMKGSFEYHYEGELFDYMKSINPPKHPGHAAVVLLVEEAYSGSEKLL